MDRVVMILSKDAALHRVLLLNVLVITTERTANLKVSTTARRNFLSLRRWDCHDERRLDSSHIGFQIRPRPFVDILERIGSAATTT